MRNPEDAEPFAWLLLSVYAHINERMEEVSNDEELAFQNEVIELLSRGWAP